jgi:hypothetical protein
MIVFKVMELYSITVDNSYDIHQDFHMSRKRPPAMTHRRHLTFYRRLSASRPPKQIVEGDESRDYSKYTGDA